jgi:hypothetical protein
MKQFLMTLCAVVIGGFLALIAYDYFVVKPRAANVAEDARVAEKSSVDVDLEHARAEAREVAAEVEISVQRSVDSARDAMREQAQDADRRTLASDAVRRATMFRATLTEYYQTHGRWPKTSDDAGLPSPDEMRGPGVKDISLGERGVVVVTLDDDLAANGKIVLRPNVNTATGIVDWTCELEGDASLKGLLPRCERAR